MFNSFLLVRIQLTYVMVKPKFFREGKKAIKLNSKVRKHFTLSSRSPLFQDDFLLHLQENMF